MKPVTLKVQTKSHSVNGMVSSGIPMFNQQLTFHAYSDEMKARVLEGIAIGMDYKVKTTKEAHRRGEWYEEPMEM
jgi:hypothetical protein